MEQHNLLYNIFIFLLAAVIAVPIAKRLGLGAIIGYLLAGIAIGPWALKLVPDEKSIMHFAEFGVVLMLFLIGLELKPALLWRMKKTIFGLGSLQILLTSALIFIPVFLFTDNINQSIIVSSAFALSSTAVALQILNEKKLIKTSAGEASFSVLLMQDIAVVPILALVGFLGVQQSVESSDSGFLNALKIIGVILAIIFIGRYVLRYIFRFIAKTNIPEIFTAFSLLIVVGIAILMDYIGLSMALGTFIAGVLLADSEYRHKIETDIEPFKGLLLGLFFISIGMSINFGVILTKPLLIIFGVLLIVLIKFLVMFSIAKPFKLLANDRFIFAFTLSQISEFAFVILAFSLTNGIINKGFSDVLTVIIALSMLTTPLLILMYFKIIAPKFNKKTEQKEFDNIDEENSVIIAGFGRFGQSIGRILHAQKYSTTILDHDANHIEIMKKFGFKVFYGDASRIDLLHSAGAAKAKIFVLAIDDPESSIKTLEVVKQNFPNLKIVARARNREHAFRLINMGVDVLSREVFESSILMAEETLKLLGMHAYEAKKIVQKFKKHDIKILKEHAKHVDEDLETKATYANASRKQLEKILKSDNAEGNDNKNYGWSEIDEN
jgi:glutathione-regulated potassium-efflux system ancillary protein KefC